MPTGDSIIDLVPQVPFLGKDVGRIQISIARLVNLLIASNQVAIQRHERIVGTAGGFLRDGETVSIAPNAGSAPGGTTPPAAKSAQT